MADFYSNHYSGLQGATGHFTTLQSPTLDRVKAGLGGSRKRHKFCQISVPNGQDLADNDVIRLFDVKSGDRPIQLFFTNDVNWGATADFNVGLHEKGANNDGAVIDEDLFESTPFDISGAIVRVDVFSLAVLDEWDRCKTFWELANIGDGSYSVDPRETWTVTMTAEGNPSAAAALVEMLVELEYIAGD